MGVSGRRFWGKNSAMQIAPSTFGTPGAPAWVVALSTASFLGGKLVLAIRSNGNSNGNGKRTAEVDEWRGRMLVIAEQTSRSLEMVSKQQQTLLGAIDRMGSMAGDTIKLLREHDNWERIEAAKRGNP